MDSQERWNLDRDQKSFLGTPWVRRNLGQEQGKRGGCFWFLLILACFDYINIDLFCLRGGP